MLVDGTNYLLVKNSHLLQKTFEGDWTVSFALIWPTVQDGFWGYLLQKGLSYGEKTPMIFKHVESNQIRAGISTSQ